MLTVAELATTVNNLSPCLLGERGEHCWHLLLLSWADVRLLSAVCCIVKSCYVSPSLGGGPAMALSPALLALTAFVSKSQLY